MTKCAFKAQSKQRAPQRKIKPCTPSRARHLARRAARLSQCDKDTATWIDNTVVWINSRPARKLAMPLPPSAPPTSTPPPPEMDVLQTNIPAPPPPLPQASARKICNSACMPACACSEVKSITQTEERFAFDDPGLPAGRTAGEPLTIRLPGGGALLLRVPPGACADAVVRRAASACGLAPSQLALFCGGRRLLGPAPLRQADDVRGGGTMRVVQRLAGGGAGAGRMRDAKQAAAARFGLTQAAADDPARVAAEQAIARLVTGQPDAEEAARVAAEQAEARLATVQAAAEGVAAAEVAGPPPHLPPAREVAVGEQAIINWKYCGGTEIEAALASGAVALLDSRWAINHAARGGVLLPRQALPDEAFISLSEVQASIRGIGWNPTTLPLPVICVSHCWLQLDHPDPHGHNLRAVARALGFLASEGGPHGVFRAVVRALGLLPSKRFGVFFDFCSIHQNCRDRDGAPQGTAFSWLEKEGRLADGAVGRFPAEDVLFNQALGSLGTFYSHPKTPIVMLTAFPPDYDDPTQYTRSGNVKPYLERGWCFCESSIAAMVKHHDMAYDLGKDTGEGEFDVVQYRRGRKAPVLPEEFVAQLASKGFTNGSTDTPLVAGLYSTGFEARFGAVTWLSYAYLRWGDEEARAVARVLSHAPVLQVLDLGANSIGDKGARALAEALPNAPVLEVLWLATNSIGAEGARALAEALQRALATLRLLNLENNSIGSEAAAALHTAWGSRSGRLELGVGVGVQPLLP